MARKGKDLMRVHFVEKIFSSRTSVFKASAAQPFFKKGGLLGEVIIVDSGNG